MSDLTYSTVEVLIVQTENNRFNFLCLRGANCVQTQTNHYGCMTYDLLNSSELVPYITSGHAGIIVIKITLNCTGTRWNTSSACHQPCYCPMPVFF